MIEHVQVFADSPDAAAQNDSRQGDTRTGADRTLLRWIVAALALTVAVRFFTLAFSWYGIRPVSGMAFLWFSHLSTGLSAALGLMELGLVVLAMGAAVVIAAGVRRNPERWRRPARVLGWTLAISTAAYLISIIVPVTLSLASYPDASLESYLVVAALVVVLGANLVLLRMGGTIARLARSSD